MYAPSLVSGIMSAELVSTSSGATAPKMVVSRSPSNPGARRSKPRGSTPPCSIATAPSMAAKKTSSALRRSLSPTLASALTAGSSGARSQQIEQRRVEAARGVYGGSGVERAASAKAAARSITDAVAASMLEAAFQRIKEEMDASRKQAARATHESERAQEALERPRVA